MQTIFDENEIQTEGFSLRPSFSGKLFGRLVGYSVVVEGWEKRTSGRIGRAWRAEFTEEERKKIARYYPKFYKWYLVTGLPDRVCCSLQTLALLQRAANFFGGI